MNKIVLRTKSIREKDSPMDGTRICVMRSYNPEKHPEYYPVHEHDIDLSPSPELLKDYKAGLSWEGYVERFTKETLVPQAEKIKGLAKRALTEDITLLCYEDSPDFCHRRLDAYACKMYEPDLELFIK